MNTALVLVDIQNDFCEGGALAVTGGEEVARKVAALVEANPQRWSQIVATADWHIDPGAHFSAEPDFVDSWPVHCVADTEGAQFHPLLQPVVSCFDAVFAKGEYEAAYSGFEGKTTLADGTQEGLADWLRAHDIDAIDVAGIATDHCVRATVYDGLRAGFQVTVFADLIAGVDPQRSSIAVEEMGASGAVISESGA